MGIGKNIRSPKAWVTSLLSIVGVWFVAYVLTRDVKVASLAAGAFVVLGLVGVLIT